jgi:glycosyltransferase involved in cell wall biosynthesis
VKLLSVNMTSDLASGGGSAARLVQVTRVLLELGVSCTVATADANVSADVAGRLHGARLICLPSVGGRFRVPVGGFLQLDAAVADADVVMLLNHWTMINVLAWRSLRRHMTPFVVCPAGALPTEGGRSRFLKTAYNALAGRRIVAEANACIAVTEQERAQFAAYGIDPASVTVIPNGMPEPRPGNPTALRRRLGIGESDTILLFMGRLAPIKGPDLLIEAFASRAARRSNTHLVMAGPDDGMLSSLRAQVERAGVEQQVHFTGFLDEQQKADALAAASIVVVPSRREAMSIVVLEAAAAARPVVVTDQCGVPDVGTSGGGWEVPPTASALAEAIDAALANSDALAERGRAWRAAATARYSWEVVGRRYLDLFAAVQAGVHEHPRR